MNSEQLQDWLTDLNERWKNHEKSSSSSGGGSKNGGRNALRELTADCALLNRETDRTQFLINYLVCNYTDVDLAQPILGQLLACYYRHGLLRYFTLQCLPSLIHLYLLALAKRQRRSASMLEAFIVAIYNEEILAGGPGPDSYAKKVDEVRIPSIRYPSVYHDPKKFNIAPELTSFKTGSSTFIQTTVKIGPYDSYERITPENRQTVLTRLLRSAIVLQVNSCLCRLSKDIICRYMCLSTLALCHSGFSFPDSDLKSRLFGKDSTEVIDDYSKKPRLKISSQYLLEAINGLYFALFNGTPELAVQAIDAVHRRALYELYANVILVTNSIRTSLLEGGVSKNEALFIIKSTSNKVDTRKRTEMITNASLRLKKMPEDIAPVVEDDSKGPSFTESVDNLRKKWVTKMDQHRFRHFRHHHRRKSESFVDECSSDIELEQISEEEQGTDAVVEHLAKLTANSAPSNSLNPSNNSNPEQKPKNGAAKVLASVSEPPLKTVAGKLSVNREETSDFSLRFSDIRHMDSEGDI